MRTKWESRKRRMRGESVGAIVAEREVNNVVSVNE